MKKILLIFPNQLFNLSNIKLEFKDIAIIEDCLFFGCDAEWKIKFHRQKIIFHKATMDAYKEVLEKNGNNVIYIKHKRYNRTEDNLNYLAKKGFNHFVIFELFDWSLDKRIKEFCLKHSYKLEIKKNEMFLTNESLIKDTLKQTKIHGMQKFYKKQRQNLNILMEKDGSPTGGEWSFDKMNRKKLPNTIKVPKLPSIKTNKFVEKAKNDVNLNYKDYFGNDNNFNYPVTHREAEEWLDDFLDKRFNLFGDYEDAISSKHNILWHSLLSPLLNSGLLSPKQIIDKAEVFYLSHKVKINSYEGFIRQIIGWREFIQIIYKRNNIELRNGNFWGFEDKPIPSSFYTGNTGIRPLDD